MACAEALLAGKIYNGSTTSGGPICPLPPVSPRPIKGLVGRHNALKKIPSAYTRRGGALHAHVRNGPRLAGALTAHVRNGPRLTGPGIRTRALSGWRGSRTAGGALHRLPCRRLRQAIALCRPLSLRAGACNRRTARTLRSHTGTRASARCSRRWRKAPSSWGLQAVAAHHTRTTPSDKPQQ